MTSSESRDTFLLAISMYFIHVIRNKTICIYNKNTCKTYILYITYYIDVGNRCISQ